MEEYLLLQINTKTTSKCGVTNSINTCCFLSNSPGPDHHKSQIKLLLELSSEDKKYTKTCQIRVTKSPNYNELYTLGVT